MARREVRDFYGKILGYLEDEGSRVVARNFYGQILGYYYKDEDKTRNFYGQIVCSGDGTQGLIMMDSNGGGQ